MGTYYETAVVPERIDDISSKRESENIDNNEKFDAGALFVLQSKGSWVHCGYHLTTSIVAPALLSLPYAFAFLGWAAGIICLLIGASVTFYSYNLLSVVLEHHAQLGRRHLRFRDMAYDILGPRWGKYVVGPVQFAVCYGAVVGACLLGGQCMKAIYILFNPNGAMKLYEFITIFGCLMLILAQMPSFHSLRHINLISILLCLGYSAAATAGSIILVAQAAALEAALLLDYEAELTANVLAQANVEQTEHDDDVLINDACELPHIQTTHMPSAQPDSNTMMKLMHFIH